MASGADALEFAALVPSRWIVMIRRAIPAFVTLIALSQTATAGVPLFGHVSCGVVRFYVAKYSQAAAEKWARGQGVTISWDDGDTTSIQHNDMEQVERRVPTKVM